MWNLRKYWVRRTRWRTKLDHMRQMNNLLGSAFLLWGWRNHHRKGTSLCFTMDGTAAMLFSCWITQILPGRTRILNYGCNYRELKKSLLSKSPWYIQPTGPVTATLEIWPICWDLLRTCYPSGFVKCRENGPDKTQKFEVGLLQQTEIMYDNGCRQHFQPGDCRKTLNGAYFAKWRNMPQLV